MSFSNMNIQWINTKHKIVIPIIVLIGIIIRGYIFPYEVPFSVDALDIFTYALKTSQTFSMPEGFALSNNGWPLFISLFFSIFNTGSFFELVHLQRILSIIFSILTVIPIYYLASKLFNKSLALVAISLFIFDFRLIIDSVQGGNMPIFIFLTTLGLCLFFKTQKMIYLSFVIFALAAVVRYEGLLIFLPISIMYFIRFRKQKIKLFKYLIAISLALLILLPIAYLRIDNTGSDGFTNGFSAITSYYNNELLTGYSAQCPHDNPSCVTKMINDEPWTEPGKDNVTPFIIEGLSGLIKYFSWISIPVFFIFLIPSLFFILKNQSFRRINFETWTIIFSSLILLLPAFYAYGRHFEEARYLFIIFPFISILCLNGLNFERLKQSKFFILIMIGVILVISTGAISYKDMEFNNQYNREVFEISTHITNNVNGINYFYPESQFIKSAEAYEKWPDTLDINSRWSSHVFRTTNLIDSANYNSLIDFIKDSELKGLSHLYTDGKNFRNKIETDVFHNEQDYPYLIKEYDSKDKGLDYHVKIFKIDYEKFRMINE